MVASAEGFVRIYKTDFAETKKDMLFSGRTEALDVSTDKRQMADLPPSNVVCKENDKLVIEFMPDVAGNINNTCVLRIPCRHKNLATGSTYDDELTLATITHGLLAANTACAAGVWTRVGYYLVKAQDAVKLGKGIVSNSQIYVSLNSA